MLSSYAPRTKPTIQTVKSTTATGSRYKGKSSSKRGAKKGNRARSTAVGDDDGSAVVGEEEEEEVVDDSAGWRLDGVVFLGDLNYRTDLPRLEVIALNYTVLYCTLL